MKRIEPTIYHTLEITAYTFPLQYRQLNSHCRPKISHSNMIDPTYGRTTVTMALLAARVQLFSQQH